jgi:four helix bundle protein
MLDEAPGVSRTMGKQLQRSGTSVDANVEEGQASQSRADFSAKYAIACKEARETLYGLRLLAACEIVSEHRLGELISEANELVCILTAIVKKTRRTAKLIFHPSPFTFGQSLRSGRHNMITSENVRVLHGPRIVHSPAAAAEHRFEWVTCATGWLLMVSAVAQIIFRSGIWIHHGYLAPATVLTLISVTFLFLLRPRLGSFHELPAIISAFVIFVTALMGLTHVLGNQGDWPLARVYQTGQEALIGLLSRVTGEGIATVSTSPLYLFCAFILLISFAYQSYKGFLLFISLPLIYGLYPWDIGILTGYLLWFAGFMLLWRDTLYLPRAVEERLHMRPALREMLIEARDRPLTEREVLFYLGGTGAETPPHVRQEVEAVADAGLLEYSRDTGKVYPTKLLEQSYLPQPIAHLIELLSTLAGYVLLVLGITYFMIPTDLVPEALFGPLGYLDDLVLLALGSLPAGSQLLGKLKGALGRRGPNTRGL